MPGSFLTKSERQRLEQFPPEITGDDLAVYFTLTPLDKSFIIKQRREHNRFGFAVLLCTLRYLGFCPNDLQSIPTAIIDYLGKQLKIASNKLAQYGTRAQTRTEHLQVIQHYLGFHKAEKKELQSITGLANQSCIRT
jgi:TnpA family transposase